MRCDSDAERSSLSRRTYLLPTHVHFCLLPAGAVFLDLKRDKYFALDPTQAAALATIVPGWPGAFEPRDNAAQPDFSMQVGDALVEDGLLTRDASVGKCAAPPILEPVQEVLSEPDARIRSTAGAIDVARFVTACTRVRIELSFRDLHTIERRLSRRKIEASSSGRRCSVDKLEAIVCVYNFLRAFTFTAKRACLFDSLVLVDFLAQYDIYPTWAMGVRAGPFAAHSWVQYKQYVLNGTVAFVRSFTPILNV
jgi:hypothetical protein